MWMTINYLLALLLISVFLKRIVTLPTKTPAAVWPVLRSPLKQCHEKLLSIDVLLEKGPVNPFDLPVSRHGETLPYRTLGELLNWLASANPGEAAIYRKIVQALYLFQWDAGLPLHFVSPHVSAVATELRKLSLFGKPIDRTRLIQVGEPVDLKHMQPVNHGTVVLQPLGVVVFSQGTVIHKAPVLCR